MRAPFDNAASVYDEEFQSLPGTSRLRRIILQHAVSAFPPGGLILELNCGTGTDATALGKRGFRVLATDQSPVMVAEARSKVRLSELESLVSCRPLGFNHLSELDGETFDGVFSNLGGLNCLENLSPVGEQLHSLMKPGALFLAVFLSPICIWEIVSFGVRGEPKKALRRLSQHGTNVTIHGSEVRTFFHTPRSVETALHPYFRKKLLLGLNVITPPPSSVRAYSLLQPLIPFLEFVEDRIARFPPFSMVGDHYLLVFERSE